MTSNPGQQMNAVVMQACGPPAQALVVRSEPVPEPGPGEVLVEPHVGEVIAFIPLSASAGYTGDPLPEGPVAMAVHHGPLREPGQTHAALGGFVAEQGLGSRTRTAIRENYLVSLLDTDNEHGLVTEVCWPVLSTRGERES